VKILVTGGNGKLGKELVNAFGSDSLHPSSQELDIRNQKHVDNFVKKETPDIIVHTAAITDVSFCEENRKEAYETNVGGTANLINACKHFASHCYFVLISTACVFHGDAGNYVETDLPYPTNYYGLTKLLAEFVVQDSGLNNLIVRTNFVAHERWKYPRAFIDRYGTYLFASDVAVAVKSLVAQKLFGIVHVCGDTKMSMYELAKITTPDIQPMTLADYQGVPLTVNMCLASIRVSPFKISK